MTTYPNHTNQPEKFSRGDLVEVKSAEEIMETLDNNGATNKLPFMPEMLPMIGKQFRVYRRVEHFSFDGDETCGDESSVRAFPENDVVVLENCRCSGQAHNGCKRGCSIFWREAWLKPASEVTASQEQAQRHEPAAETMLTDRSGKEALTERLKTRGLADSETFYCQSSQLLVSTHPVSFKERVRRCARNVWTGNYGLIEMLRNIFVWFYVRGREKLLGPFPKGKLNKTPAESLDLQPGEIVQVKSLEEIMQTLDQRGFNRGLHFAPEMIPYCGKELRVLARADRMIAEGIGSMRSMKNTVILEDCICDSATWAFGACPRQDYIYWREIWLKRLGQTKYEEKPSTSSTPEEVMVAE